MKRSSRAMVMSLLLVACATLPPAKPATDLKAIAGKWKGSTTVEGRWFTVTSTIREDGTWENDINPPLSSDPRTVGTVAIVNGEFRWKSDTTGRTGTITLHEGEGKRVLVWTIDGIGSLTTQTPE